ncbi:hypothetical protein Rhopal_006327-T1 [Rhodotorula paludigena]|uniref:F-box domain-containing protein n=1 Tax=Rhodotorula paludigena TaxID=86838 RepID=A0AAV5GTP0_9BASI|nr:hypothetical protein Rhopal_006327-T1 [Rhodotorula paludigena]
MLDRLPDEVLTSIFSYLLAPATSTGMSARYRLLRAVGRVSRRCALVAQGMLYEIVDMFRLTNVRRFVAAVDTSERARRLALWRTRSLRLHGCTDRTETILPTFFEHLVKRLPGLREIRVHNLRIYALSLGIASRVRACYLRDVTLFISGSKERVPHLAHLETLCLANCELFDTDDKQALTTDNLLCPLALPSLQRLAITWSEAESEPHFESLRTQLTHLFLRRERDRRFDRLAHFAPLPIDDMIELTALQHLSINVCRRDDVDSLSQLDRELVTLRLECDAAHATEVERDLLSNDPRALASLDKLFVPAVAPDSLEGRYRAGDRQECDDRAIELVEYRAAPSREAVFDFGDERAWLEMTGASTFAGLSTPAPRSPALRPTVIATATAGAKVDEDVVMFSLPPAPVKTTTQ